MQQHPRPNTDFAPRTVGNALLLTLGFTAAYLFSEWLFLATAPSFMSSLGWEDKVEALLVATPPLYAIFTILLGIGVGIAFFLSHIPHARKHAVLPLAAAPALAGAILGMLLIDNFTRTMLGVGIGNGGLPGAFLYGAAALALFWIMARWCAGKIRRGVLPGRGARIAGTATLLALPLLGALVAWHNIRTISEEIEPVALSTTSLATLPNIVFMAADGVPVRYLSLYGHERNTTPHLDRFAQDALIFDQMFSNSARTTGALTAMMTGRYPTTTKVLYPPHTLTGLDAYRNLPRMLRRLGYRGIQETVRYYADGGDLNWQESFDVANNRVLDSSKANDGLHDLAFLNARRLIEVMRDRLRERARALARQRPPADSAERLMDTAYARVYGTTDADRIRRVLEFVDAGEGPFFAHIHLMETHCCTWRPDTAFFSGADGLSEAARRGARFADEIRESDELMGELLKGLEERGELDNTLFIYSSDHGLNWKADERLPLVIRFPGGEHAGRTTRNAQLIDIAPTVLDHLGIRIPGWMEGQSLLAPESLRADRPIFAVTQLNREYFRSSHDRLAQLVGEGPPGYGMKVMSMTVCNRYYTFDMENGNTRSAAIAGHTGDCGGHEPPDNREAARMIREHLFSRNIGKGRGEAQ